jgi:hypothetical protein
MQRRFDIVLLIKGAYFSGVLVRTVQACVAVMKENALIWSHALSIFRELLADTFLLVGVVEDRRSGDKLDKFQESSACSMFCVLEIKLVQEEEFVCFSNL